MKPLLSIIIATKNRVPYCINSVETILSFSDNDFELIVQDNTDNLELSDYIKTSVSDKRLIYNYTPPPFSSIDNFNAAFNLASGEYVCMIGDDDGLNPEFLNIVRFAHKNGIESLGSSQIAEYYWPGAVERHKDGNFSIPQFTGSIISFDPKKRLIPLLMTGIVNYIPFNLPRVYHGLVKRSLLEKIKEKNGYYFGGLSPDIYSTIALTLLIKKHFLVDYPLTIAGTCPSSTSAASENGEHCGHLGNAPHLRNRDDYKWEDIIPKYYSIQTIWAETAIKSLKESNNESFIKYFSLKFLVAQSLNSNPSIRDLIMMQTKIVLLNENKSFVLFKIEVYFLILAIKGRGFIGRLKQILHKKKDKKINYNNVQNIKDATFLLNAYVKKKGFNISLFDKS